ncbi:hypothetical protein H9L39_01736 [Fusarium oxysporum f. sp. albedinis]|nr:hypothetical protein H9L39_01736 [Fusarium oxysporum f. sp. albedinis]
MSYPSSTAAGLAVAYKVRHTCFSLSFMSGPEPARRQWEPLSLHNRNWFVGRPYSIGFQVQGRELANMLG